MHWGVGLNKKVVARFYYPKDSADLRLMIGGCMCAQCPRIPIYWWCWWWWCCCLGFKLPKACCPTGLGLVCMRQRATATAMLSQLKRFTLL